jgi:hypothetical protein
VRSSDFKFLGDYRRNIENGFPEFLLGDRGKGKELMVWNLGVVIYQVITRGKLFSSALISFPFTQLSAIRAILGTPSECVVEQWPTLPKRDYLPSQIQPDPSILEDKLNRNFPLPMDLKIMVQNMFEYDPPKRWKLHDCARHLFFIGITEHISTPVSVPECPSMDIFMNRSRERQQATTRAIPLAILAPLVNIGVAPQPISPERLP